MHLLTGNKRYRRIAALCITMTVLFSFGLTAYAEPSFRAADTDQTTSAGMSAGADERADYESDIEDIINDIDDTDDVQITFYDSSLAGISAALTNYTGNDPESDLALLRASSPYAYILDEYENIGIVRCSGFVNVRKGPGTGEVICGRIYNGCDVDITGESDGWYAVTSGNVTGYVSSDYVVTGTEAQILALQLACVRAYINESGLHVRSGPGTDYSSMGSLYKGESYEVIGSEHDGWIEIEYGSGSGYVSADYVTVEAGLQHAEKITGVSASNLRNSVVNYALQFVGNPYVWGGTSLTRGCDCSGFTMGVMSHFGVRLSHSSASQRNEGRRISVSEAQPGDLICYSGHVGIYIGGGQVVHAADERHGIIVSGVYMMTPVCAVNVLG